MKAKLIFLFLALFLGTSSKGYSSILDNIDLKENDSVLVVQEQGEPLFSWQIAKPLIPASLTKLVTAHLAIERWGLSHRFYTDFFVDGGTLWVKGYGDPFLVSEELDKIIPKLRINLQARNALKIKSLNIDNSHFDITTVPGRSRASDPYNAPISAVSANFNTAKLRNINGRIESAETQTPLTNTALKMAHTLTKHIDRVNLINADNAQTNFAELLLAKLGWSNVEISIGQKLTDSATPLYRYENSNTLAEVLRGTLEFSNNFMANQVFLKLSENESANSASFLASHEYSHAALSRYFGWQNHHITEGSGLSRQNRLSAKQIDDLLKALAPHKRLFKKIKIKSKSAIVYAKTGTLDGVRSYAGYIEIPAQSENIEAKQYRFVFNFNRTVPYGYRDKVLDQLVSDLERL